MACKTVTPAGLPLAVDGGGPMERKYRRNEGRSP
ncbi:hypothetical protein BH09PSE5_BH09PSE5_06220 [soil metagenome]